MDDWQGDDLADPTETGAMTDADMKMENAEVSKDSVELSVEAVADCP